MENSDPELYRAKRLIEGFCYREYGTVLDEDVYGADLTDVGLAFTTITDDEIEIQVSVDLVNFRLNTFLNGKLVKTDQYKNLEELNDLVLSNLDFDDLTYESDDLLMRYQKRYGMVGNG